MLAPAERLRRRDEFAATIKAGRRAARGSLVVHMRTNAIDDPVRTGGITPPTRAGFVVSKAVGGAVVRNQVKRRLRHLVRACMSDLPSGTDLVVRALPAAATRSFQELGADLAQALEAANRPRRSAR